MVAVIVSLAVIVLGAVAGRLVLGWWTRPVCVVIRRFRGAKLLSQRRGIHMADPIIAAMQPGQILTLDEVQDQLFNGDMVDLAPEAYKIEVTIELAVIGPNQVEAKTPGVAVLQVFDLRDLTGELIAPQIMQITVGNPPVAVVVQKFTVADPGPALASGAGGQ